MALIRHCYPDLTHFQRQAIAYDWRVMGRDDQQPPPFDWPVWLIKAGRGYGKTRTGSEWVRMVAENNPRARIALVGPTAADVRDVMVEGESGIRACAPPWAQPVYEPSKRRLTWPNGAIATTYSADEPDRLRGPQHTHAWCLAGDTPVLMADGTQKEISNVVVGDMVQTRKGPRACIGSMLTRRNALVYRLMLVDGRSIIGTADHPVWIDGIGFIPLQAVTKEMKVCVTPVSNGVVKFGTDTAGITSAHLDCIVRSGSPRTDLSRKEVISITSMATNQTTGSKILSCLHTESTADCTPTIISDQLGTLQSGTLARNKKKIDRKELKSEYFTASFAIMSSEVLPNTRLSFAPVGAFNAQEMVHLNQNFGFASIAENNTQQSGECRDIAQGDAIDSPQSKELEHWSNEMCLAPSAKKYSNPSVKTQDFVSGNAPLLSTLKIASVERLVHRIDVYDIAVDGEREFFANGILVHNCDEAAAWRYPDAWDMLMMGLRLGELPQVVVTTTPRPVPLMKTIQNWPGCVVTRGRTADNASNLAPTFLTSLMAKYEGTRLGRQELEGEDLDDNPDALWQRDALDAHRVRQWPELTRIVVAIDPAVTSRDDSDETGIIVAGVGADRRGYVLADLSGRHKPDAWGRIAINAYHEWKADRIVAESNQGGEMVSHVLRTIDGDVPVRLVHASRGKVARAEPVAALYEQGRVSHVGTLAKLEDQLCTWSQGQASPDRMDALVWAVTELMLGRGEIAFG